MQSRITAILCRTPSKEADERIHTNRQDLAGWYQGACQHCGQVITKRDGKPHFHTRRLKKVAAAKFLDKAFNNLLLCPNCAAWIEHNAWGFGQEFRVRWDEIFTFDPQWPVPTAPTAAGGYCPASFSVAGQEWEMRFHPDHYELIRVTYAELGI